MTFNAREIQLYRNNSSITHLKPNRTDGVVVYFKQQYNLLQVLDKCIQGYRQEQSIYNSTSK